MNKENTLANAWMSKDLWYEARVVAASLDISRSELVRRALKKYMEEVKDDNRTKNNP